MSPLAVSFRPVISRYLVYFHVSVVVKNASVTLGLWVSVRYAMVQSPNVLPFELLFGIDLRDPMCNCVHACVYTCTFVYTCVIECVFMGVMCVVWGFMLVHVCEHMYMYVLFDVLRNLFLKQSDHLTFPRIGKEGFNFSTSLLKLIFCFANSQRSRVTPLCVHGLQFPDDGWVQLSF